MKRRSGPRARGITGSRYAENLRKLEIRHGQGKTDILAFKRSCRAALLTFFAYAEGSLNLILEFLNVASTPNQHKPDQRKSQRRQTKRRATDRQRRNFFDKITIIEELAGVQQKESQSTNFTEVRQLRNAIEHWTADRNLEIFDQLMLDTVLNLESRFVAWVRCLPEKCHGVIDYDSRSVMEKLRTLVEKQYGVENTVKSESKHES